MVPQCGIHLDRKLMAEYLVKNKNYIKYDIYRKKNLFNFITTTGLFFGL